MTDFSPRQSMKVARLFLVVSLPTLLHVVSASAETPKEPKPPPTNEAECRVISVETSPPYTISVDCSKVCDRPTTADPGSAAYALWHQICDSSKTNK